MDLNTSQQKDLRGRTRLSDRLGEDTSNVKTDKGPGQHVHEPCDSPVGVKVPSLQRTKDQKEANAQKRQLSWITGMRRDAQTH